MIWALLFPLLMVWIPSDMDNMEQVLDKKKCNLYWENCVYDNELYMDKDTTFRFYECERKYRCGEYWKDGEIMGGREDG